MKRPCAFCVVVMSAIEVSNSLKAIDLKASIQTDCSIAKVYASLNLINQSGEKQFVLISSSPLYDTGTVQVPTAIHGSSGTERKSGHFREIQFHYQNSELISFKSSHQTTFDIA